MDSEEDIARGVVRLVTAPARTLRWYEEPPRPYETGWVQREHLRKKAERKAERIFPLPEGGSPYDLNHAAEVNRTFREREKFVREATGRLAPLTR